MWTPVLDGAAPTLGGRLLDALGRDIAAGILPAGTKLPTHRDLAHALGIGIGTVTAAYAEAARRGLVEARVGSGTFIASGIASGHRPMAAAARIALSHNVSPLAPAQRRFAAALARVQKRADLLDHLGYAPAAGLPAHREAARNWLTRTGGPLDIDPHRLIVTSGGQNAMALTVLALCRPGDTILVEAATYFGVRTLAEHAGCKVVGVAMDEQGLLPDALDRAARANEQSGARLVYTMPSLQNPTGRIASPGRRRAIAEVARKRDLLIVEDDVYGALLLGDAPPPLADFAPERTIYINGLSKTIAPGLRTGYLLAPDAAIFDRIIAVVRALNYAPPPIGSMIATQWIEDGTADEIVIEMAAEIAARTTMARARLGAAVAAADARCPHLWLELPELDAERLVSRAARNDVDLTPPGAPVVDAASISGVRLCVGSPSSRAELSAGLDVVANILSGSQQGDALGIV